MAMRSWVRTVVESRRETMDPNVRVTHELGLAPFPIHGRVRRFHMSVHCLNVISTLATSEVTYERLKINRIVRAFVLDCETEFVPLHSLLRRKWKRHDVSRMMLIKA